MARLPRMGNATFSKGSWAHGRHFNIRHQERHNSED